MQLTTTHSKSKIDWIMGQIYFRILFGSLPPKVDVRALQFVDTVFTYSTLHSTYDTKRIQFTLS